MSTPATAITILQDFRAALSHCLGRRADALFELADAILTTLRHNIGNAGVYLEWQETRQVRGAVLALTSHFLLREGRVFLPS